MTVPQKPWWQGAAIYQVYPRSFADSNADGIGDLKGIIKHLPHIAGLGFDAVWVSPFLKSPQDDFGYDVSDYKTVDPQFGDNKDFAELITTAHALGLKVLMDLVMSHTSAQHPWFAQSRASRDNDKADWYVWADPKPDGTPPNNWICRFTHDSAWTWEPRREQYYLHNFLKSQPDLNYHNPAVRAAVLDVCQYWLDQGVDGFRFDVVNMYYHDAQLRDNPPMSAGEPNFDDLPRANPLSYQRQLYNRTRPENMAFVRDMRKLMDSYKDITSIGEISDDDNLRTSAAYTAGDDHLHMAYNPFLLRDVPFSTALIRKAIALTRDNFAHSWPMWTSGNHDCMRLATRWGNAFPGQNGTDPRFQRLALGMLASLRGTFLMYQGDELGLPEADIPFALLQDPYGIAMWPDGKGRDGCRTPMPWHSTQENAGFTLSQPWLPVPEAHHPLAVDKQQGRPESVLEGVRHFMAWRKTHPALLYGGLELHEHVPDSVIAVTRPVAEGEGGKSIFCAFNLSAAVAVLHLNTLPLKNPTPLEGHGLGHAAQQGSSVQLEPFSAFYAEVD